MLKLEIVQHRTHVLPLKFVPLSVSNMALGSFLRGSSLSMCDEKIGSLWTMWKGPCGGCLSWMIHTSREQFSESSSKKGNLSHSFPDMPQLWWKAAPTLRGLKEGKRFLTFKSHSRDNWRSKPNSDGNRCMAGLRWHAPRSRYNERRGDWQSIWWSMEIRSQARPGAGYICSTPSFHPCADHITLHLVASICHIC